MPKVSAAVRSDNVGMSKPADEPWLAEEISSPTRIFFDPQGRISRRTFWLYGVLAMAGLSLMVRALLAIAGVPPDNADGLTSLLLLWPAVAISAKRWHDRDRSGWWVLVALIPLVGWLWMLVDNGFVRGTPGRNRYGEAPAL